MKRGLITLARVKNAGWIAAFVALSAFWGYEAMNASQQSRSRHDPGIFICPILGKRGPAGTPGLGTW